MMLVATMLAFLATSSLPVPTSAVNASLASQYAASSGNDFSIVATSKAGLMLLDSSGKLLAWHPEPFQKWPKNPVASNPRNQTICWVVDDESLSNPAVLRCATVDRLNQTWDLAPPRNLAIGRMNDIVYDWTGGNWYMTVGRQSYVCDYQLEKCLELASERGDSRFTASYDLPRRMVFRIVNDGHLSYKLQSLRLDGSDIRILPTELRRPKALSVDQVNERVFFIEYTNRSETIYSVDYNGEDRKEVTEFVYTDDFKWDRGVQMDAFDGRIVFKWGDGNQNMVSMMTLETGKRTDLVAGSVAGETIPALANVTDLLDVRILTPASQPDVENRCNDKATKCSDFCVPIVDNGSAAATCFCEEGYEIVEFSCRKSSPAYAVIADGNSLQAVDLQREEVTTILYNTTNVTRMDFLVESEEDFLLFWIDDGSLFRGRYLPRECHSPSSPSSCAATVREVSQLVQATNTTQVVQVAVDWDFHHVVWLERDLTKAVEDESALIVKMAPLDGSYRRTLLTTRWYEPRAIVVHPDMHYFSIYHLDESGDLKISPYDMNGDAHSSRFGLFDGKLFGLPPETVAVDVGLRRYSSDRVVWFERATRSIQYLTDMDDLFDLNRTQVLTHPSLAHAGGIDVLQSRVFWTDSAAGTLFSADSYTGEDVREEARIPGAGFTAVRVLHPYRQPKEKGGKRDCSDDRAGCSHFCVTGAYWYRPSCLCPDGMQLGGDRKTCEKAQE